MKFMFFPSKKGKKKQNKKNNKIALGVQKPCHFANEKKENKLR